MIVTLDLYIFVQNIIKHRKKKILCNKIIGMNSYKIAISLNNLGKVRYEYDVIHIENMKIRFMSKPTKLTQFLWKCLSFFAYSVNHINNIFHSKEITYGWHHPTQTHLNEMEKQKKLCCCHFFLIIALIALRICLWMYEVI